MEDNEKRFVDNSKEIEDGKVDKEAGEKKYPDNYKAFLLTGGLEIFGNLIKETDEEYIINKPGIDTPMQAKTPKGDIVKVFKTFPFWFKETKDETISVKKIHVMIMSDLSGGKEMDLKKVYEIAKAEQSTILQPNKSLIVPGR